MTKRIAMMMLALGMSAFAAGGEPGTEGPISAERMLAHTRHLASDRLGGRAPGSEGEKLTLEYLVGEFDAMGCAPGNPDGTYFQLVPLVGSRILGKPGLSLEGENINVQLKYGAEFVCWTLRSVEHVAVERADVVFVGYGVVAPEYGWNDYKDIDVSGKIVVVLVGDPPHPDEALFAGRAMTYYGRWTYKYEIAAEKGAAGVIVIHSEDQAGYPWAVVENSWSGEQFDVVRKDGGASRCTFESWITAEAAERMFMACGETLAEARAQAVSPEFRPRSLGLRGTVYIDKTIRRLDSHNVVARLPGNDPALSQQHVIYTAHWDHLGRGKPVDGDSIYNGAMDNASGVAGVLEIARAFAARRKDIKRSVLFIMTTAEESGLLGAQHYVDNPLYPLEQTVAMINVDGLNVWGRTSDVTVLGYGQSDLDTLLAGAAASQERRTLADREPEKGYYYRSDHFPFAKKGIPALYANGGVEYIGRPQGWGVERRREFLRNRYHKPLDEVDSSWDLSGAVEDMEVLFTVGLGLVMTDARPKWSEKSEFRRAREELLKERR